MRKCVCSQNSKLTAECASPEIPFVQFVVVMVRPVTRGKSRTVVRKFSVGGLCVCAGGLDILKIDKSPSDL